MIPSRHAQLARTLLAAFAMFSAPAQAQLFRAYLSLDGSDANACTLPAPCRLLPAAPNAVADGGEVWMLDSANYNTAPVTVTKSVTILAVPGAIGSVLATTGNASAVVVGNAGPGLYVTAFTPSTTKVDIADSSIDGNGAAGVQLVSTAADRIVEATLRGSRITRNAGAGLYENTAQEPVFATMSPPTTADADHGTRDGAPYIIGTTVAAPSVPLLRTALLPALSRIPPAP